MDIIDFVRHLDNETKILYIILCIILLFFFTTVLKVTLGHILAFFVILLTLWWLITNNNKEINVFDHDLEYKLKMLQTNGFIPENLYIDADLILLLYDIRISIQEYNPDAYENLVKACDNMLKIRKDFELKLVDTPSIINLHTNFDTNPEKLLDYNLQINSEDKVFLINAYANFTVAEDQMKAALNELHSFIITIPSSEVMHYTHIQMCKRLNVLLKRNLDIMFNIYKKNKKIYDPVVFGYDSTEEYNKTLGFQETEPSFSFY